jgi:uncharacterized protein YggE
MKLIRLAAIGAAVAAAVVFAGVGRPESASSDTTPPQTARSITVTGSGTISATPTQAAFDFGVSTRGKTAVQALADDSDQIRKLIAALEGAGIPATALQTSSVSLSPVTNDDDSAIVGYTASNTVSATIDDLSRAGTIVDTAVNAGANQVDGPNLTVADQSKLYSSALEAAVADARAKAGVLAAAGGLQLGAVTSIEENGSSGPIPFADAKAAAEPTPIQAGTTQITANVTVVFEGS